MIRIVELGGWHGHYVLTAPARHKSQAEFKKTKTLGSILSLDFTSVKKARMRSERSDIAKGLAPELRVKRTDCNFQLLIRLVHLPAFGSWESSYSIHHYIGA